MIPMIWNRVAKMRYPLVFIVLILLQKHVGAQDNVRQVLEQVESNNPSLSTIRKQMEARQIQNRTGIFLSDPEAEYAWFAGSPSSIGNKYNLMVRQHFDFPTAYIQRNRLSHALNKQLIAEYEQYRREVLMEARLVCLELIYHNTLAVENNQRLQHAQTIADAYAVLLDAGHTNIIAYNKARLNLLNVRKEAENAEINRRTLHNRLITLNGGNPVDLPQTVYPLAVLPDDFGSWYEDMEKHNPTLLLINQSADISRVEYNLQKSLNLPSFSAGYTSEILSYEKFRGFSAGVSIPLWENRNTLRYARANTHALETQAENMKRHYFFEMRSAHETAITLYNAVAEYREALESADNTTILARAWEMGEISLTEYIMELTFHYESRDRLMQMELDLHKALATLHKYSE
jgi:outer membrane protein, heavy metal efflux system